MATGWLGAVPPPLGVTPNFTNPSSQLKANIALHTVCLTLATFSVAIRLYTRIVITKASLGLDDGLCVLSCALSITFSGLLIESYQWGIGRHMWDVPVIWVPTALKYFTIAQYIFQILSCTIKLTFLVLYRRIFWAQTTVMYFIYFGTAFVICSNTGLLFATIFSCTPVARAWNLMLPGHCIEPTILPWLSGGLNLATDLFTIILPMRPLWCLNMVLARKMKLIAVFSLGSFACVASLIRLVETPVLSSSPDASWNISRIAVWAVIEANVGIICASSSLLPGFFDRHCPEAIKNSIAHVWSSTTNRDTTEKKATHGISAEPNHSRSQPGSSGRHDFVELRDVNRSTTGTTDSSSKSVTR